MSKPQLAFIFDLNGTVIDDMHFHTEVWYEVLTKDLGSSLSPEEVKLHMYGKNSEVFDRIFGKGHFSNEEVEYWSLEKEKRYQKVYLPHMKLIDGLENLLNKAQETGIPMAIGSAAIPFNINFVLDNLNLHHFFKAVVSADDVTESKPHPETFLKAAQQINAKPENCIVFEDAPKGVEAAQNAGMKAVVLLTHHQKEVFEQYDNIVAMVEDYTDPELEKLFQ